MLSLIAAGCDGGDDNNNDTGMATSISAGNTSDGSGDDGSGDDDGSADGGDDDGSGDDGSADSGDDGMIDCSSPPSYATDIQPIWDAKCTSECHEDGGEWFPFILTSPSYDLVVSAPATQTSLLNQVEPGDLEASYLWAKLTDTQMSVGGSGVAMPKPHVGSTEPDALTADEMDTIEAWIVCDAMP